MNVKRFLRLPSGTARPVVARVARADSNEGDEDYIRFLEKTEPVKKKQIYKRTEPALTEDRSGISSEALRS